MKNSNKVMHKDLLIIEASLKYLSAQQTDAWYQLGKNIKIIKRHLAEFKDSHESIVEKFAAKDKSGKPILIGEGEAAEVDFGKNKDKANEYWQELLNEEISVDFYKFPYSKFGETKLDAGAIEPILDIILTDLTD